MNANFADYFSFYNLPHCIIPVGFIVMVHMAEECRPLLNLNDLTANIHKPQSDETIKQLTNHFNPRQDYKPDIAWFVLFLACFLFISPFLTCPLILNDVLQQLVPITLLTFSRSVLFKLLTRFPHFWNAMSSCYWGSDTMNGRFG